MDLYKRLSKLKGVVCIIPPDTVKNDKATNCGTLRTRLGFAGSTTEVFVEVGKGEYDILRI